MKHTETVAEFKDRSDLSAIYFTLCLAGITGSKGGMEKMVTRFNSVREVLICYNVRLLQRHVDEFHKGK